MEHREQEASLKARLTKAMVEAEQAATLNQADYNALYYYIDLDLNPTTHIHGMKLMSNLVRPV